MIDLERANCELCGAAEAIELFRLAESGADFPVVRCARCRLVYVSPRPTADAMDQFYPVEYYGEGANKFQEWIERLRRYDRRRVANSIARGLAAGSRVIDFGCGRGDILRLLAERGFACCGVERSKRAAEHARTIPRAEILTGPEATGALPDGSFDLALFLHSLEHVHHPMAALREAHRLLKPGGQLRLVLPNIRSFQAIFGGRHWFHLEVPRHLYHFSPDTLGRALAESGFAIHHVGHFSFEQNPFGVMQTVLNQVGFVRNNLYEALKSGRRRGHRVSALEMLCAVALVYPSLILSTLGSLYQRGGTLTVRAVKT